MVVLLGRNSYIITGRSCRFLTERKCDERHRSFDCFGTWHFGRWDIVLLRLGGEKGVSTTRKDAVGHRGNARVFMGELWMDVV